MTINIPDWCIIGKTVEVLMYNKDTGQREWFKEKIISRNSVTEFSQLSNGQKMRLDFSIRFGFIKLMEQRNSVNTNLLVLDESLDSSIDATGREELLEILKSEFASTKDIIIVSHNQEIKEKEEIFDRNINITKDKFSKIAY